MDQLPGVEQSQVVGVQNSVVGDDIVAVVKMKEGRETPRIKKLDGLPAEYTPQHMLDLHRDLQLKE